MFAAPDPVPEDGAGVLMQSYLSFSELRGCSDFMFVPGEHYQKSASYYIFNQKLARY